MIDKFKHINKVLLYNSNEELSPTTKGETVPPQESPDSSSDVGTLEKRPDPQRSSQDTSAPTVASTSGERPSDLDVGTTKVSCNSQVTAIRCKNVFYKAS